jgi:hypothetical protein
MREEIKKNKIKSITQTQGQDYRGDVGKEQKQVVL